MARRGRRRRALAPRGATRQALGPAHAHEGASRAPAHGARHHGFGDPPPYKEPLDFIAGDPEGGNYFESAILSGALPHFEGIELGLHALRLFLLDLAESPRPDLHLPTVQDPSRWIDYLEHLIELLQSMILEFREASGGPI